MTEDTKNYLIWTVGAVLAFAIFVGGITFSCNADRAHELNMAKEGYEQATLVGRERIVWVKVKE